MIGKMGYIRVKVLRQNRNGELICLPVNSDHETFDGAGFFPKHIVVGVDAFVPAPVDIEPETCPLFYGGRPFNRQAYGRKHKV